MKSRLLAIFLLAAFLGACKDAMDSPPQQRPAEGNEQAQVSGNGGTSIPPLGSSGGSADSPAVGDHRVKENRTTFFAPDNPTVEAAFPAPKLGEELAADGSTSPQMPPDIGKQPPETRSPISAPGQGRSREEALKIVENVEPQLKVAHTRDGQPVVQVQYPWFELPRPSMQIGWFEETADTAAAEPLAIDGAEAENHWQKQLDRLNQPTYEGSTELVKTSLTHVDRGSGELIALRGRENLLGKTSVYAVPEKAGTPVLIYLLERWADDQGTLCFAPGDFELTTQFQNPGKLRIWLLSEEQTVWSKTLSWPGRKATATDQSVPPPAEPQPQMASPPAAPAPSTPQDAGSPSKPEIAAPAPPPEPGVGPVPPMPGAAEPDGKKTQEEPQWKPSEKLASPPAGEANPPTPQPSAPPPLSEDDYEKMSVEVLAQHIEKQFGPTMSDEVRRFWVNGWKYYFRVPNPPDVRRKIFMDMLSSAYDEKPSPKLREALKTLYQKLKSEDARGPR